MRPEKRIEDVNPKSADASRMAALLDALTTTDADPTPTGSKSRNERIE